MGAESSSMQNAAAAASCGGCKDYGNRQTDTVKVDLDKIRDGLAGSGKENSAPADVHTMTKETAAQKQQRLEDPQGTTGSPSKRQKQAQAAAEATFAAAAAAKKEEEEEETTSPERRRADEERLWRLELEQRAEEEWLKQEEEERQREEEEMRRRQAQEKKRLKAEQARRAAEAERREQERIAVEKAENERLRRVEEEEARRRQEEEEVLALKKELMALEQKRARRLQAFLEEFGFQAPDEKKVKKGMMSSTFYYPLHAAVEARDAGFVELLLWAGADPKIQNSKKQTPLALAQAKNKKGSHTKVIAAFADVARK